jgi:hypothetical protein
MIKDLYIMEKNKKPMKPAAWLWGVLAILFVMCAFFPPTAQAQVPARFYWKTLSFASAVPLIYESISGNTNPFDPAHTVTPDADFEATMALAGYALTFPLYDRAAMAAIIVPMGRISGEASLAGKSVNQTARGYGDPMLEFTVNVIGPPAQKNLPDVMRYEPGFSLDLLVDLTLPVGEYDNDRALNIGQNRWYGRLGAPIVWQLGPWVPGRRTTLELLPAVWLFGDNDDYVGQKMETDPMLQLDAHLTRDFTEHLWGSLDGTWFKHGETTIDGVSGDTLNNVAVGLTLGYTINENLNLTFGYKSTVNDNDPQDLQMDGFMITLVSGWHPIIEGARRLKE